MVQLSQGVQGKFSVPKSVNGGGLVAESCLTLCDPTDCSPPGSSVHGISQARILGWVSHFLLQGIFLTQGSNTSLLCLLHCRQILYLLSQGSKRINVMHQMKNKTHDHLSRCRKCIWQDPTSIYDKSSQQSEYKGTAPQHNKGHKWQALSWHHIQQWKAESFSSKIRNKTRVPSLATVIQQSIGNLSQSKQARKRNKWHPNKKGKSKTVIVCRWQYIKYGKLKLHGETVRTWVQ